MADRVQAEEEFAKPARRAPGDFEFIRYHVEGPVARLTLQHPEHNLLNEQMLRELADGIGMVAENGGVKLIVLDAAGKVFARVWISASTPASAHFRCWTRFTPHASPWWKPRSLCW